MTEDRWQTLETVTEATALDIGPIVHFFDLLGQADDVTTLVHQVLSTLVTDLSLEFACYYRAEGHFKEQLFVEEPLTEDGPLVSLDRFQVLYVQAETEFAASAGMAGRCTASTNGQGISLVVDDGVFICSRPDAAAFDDAEIDHACALLHVAGKVIEVALRFASLESQRMQDALTGLYNRRYFDEIIPREIERANRSGAQFSLVLMDVDDFKPYNDTHGHRKGDVLLQEIATALTTTLRRVDLAIRYGGDEFALVLPHTAGPNVDILISRLKTRIEEVCKKSGPLAPTGASFGVATFPDDAGTVDSLVELADSHLYKAKKMKKTAHPAAATAHQASTTEPQASMLSSGSDNIDVGPLGFRHFGHGSRGGS